MKHTDETLIVRARGGDGEAFDELVARYKSMVYGEAYYRLRRFDDARDITQDVFVRAFLALHQLGAAGRFAPWLRRITANACNAHLRNSRRTEPLDPMAIAPDQIRPLLSQLAVEQALCCLSDSTRLTLVLFYFRSQSIAEIADYLNVKPSTIKSRLRDARARLKKEMLDMVETTVVNEPLGEGFESRVRLLAQACVRGNAEAARGLLDADDSLVHGYGEVAPEHMEFMRTENAGDGWTPLHLAGHYGCLDIVRMLVEHGADVNAVSKNAIGNTPISAAAWGNHLEIVEYLAGHGADVNAPNAWGSTALLRAVDADRLSLADLLLSLGADPEIGDRAGLTPLDIARRDNREAMAALIVGKAR